MTLYSQHHEMDQAITQLQKDILDQDGVNKEQQAKIAHLEKLVEDLIDRITVMEDKAQAQENSSQKPTRTKSTLTAAQLTTHMKELENRMVKFQHRLQEVEDIVL